MKYCLCKENWDYCKCEEHRCPKHDKITKRPIVESNFDFTPNMDGTGTVTFPNSTWTDFT